MENNKLPVSRMSKWESVFAIGWLPVHVLGLPALLLARLLPGLSAANLNFGLYVIGAFALSLLCLGFLRRDFDRLWEQPLSIVGTAVMGCLTLLVLNYILSILLSILPASIFPDTNPNNEAVLDLVKSEKARMVCTTLLLAPILEELIFRGGIFGQIRRKSRALAYVVCVLAFGVYHTWQYALMDPAYWLNLIQYLPAGVLLCWCYEQTECIWTSVFLHMLFNGVSLWALL